MKIKIKITNTEEIEIDIDGNEPVLTIKNKMYEINNDYRVDSIRLIFMGHILKDNKTLLEEKLEDGKKIHAVVTVRPPTPEAVVEEDFDAPLEDPWAQQVPSEGIPGMGGLPNMGGIPGMGGMGNMSQMLSNPALQNMMSTLMSNPENVQKISDINRRITSGELNYSNIMNDPTYREITADPSLMQNMMQLMSSDPGMMSNNPGMMQNMMGGGMENLPNFVPQTESSIPQEFNLPQIQEDSVDYKELYKDQLQQLAEFGFIDEERNIAFLKIAQGNVEIVMNRLLDS